MRYPLPVACPAAMVALIVPAFCDVRVPIFVGLAKEPIALESCAVKIFPALKFPVLV